MLDSIAEILIFGIQRGAVFSLVGLGLALVYKSTKVLNFAQGELGTIPAFVAYLVMTGFAVGDDAEVQKGLFVPAAITAIVVGAALGVVLYLVVLLLLGSVSFAFAGIVSFSLTFAFAFRILAYRKLPGSIRVVIPSRASRCSANVPLSRF